MLCGLAPDIEFLVVARVLQGVGGALLTPGSLAILQASFREADRAAAVGAWSGLGGVAGAIGPFVGGGLVDGPGWRWAFLVNVPVAIVAIACARTAVPESRDSTEHRRLDILGAALAVVGLATGTWAFTAAGDRGWSDLGVAGPLAVSVVSILAFVRRILRARDPLVPPASVPIMMPEITTRRTPPSLRVTSRPLIKALNCSGRKPTATPSPAGQCSVPPSKPASP